VNIVFVYHDAPSPLAYSTAWRGEMLFKAIQKTGLHNVELISSTDFSSNSPKTINICQNSQLIVIEGSPEIDLLNMINFWKSRDKKVVVDIPISLERICNNIGLQAEGTFSIAQMYSTYQNKDNLKVEKSERFRWGLHLADCILISSLQQQAKWQITAPVKVISDFIDLDIMRDCAKYKHDSFIIGLFINEQKFDPFLQLLIDLIIEKFPNVKWLPICEKFQLSNLKIDSIISDLPVGLSKQWPASISLIDLGIFWDYQSIRGKYYRNILELMALKIPWVLNEQKGYQDLTKYGLIIENRNNWQSTILEIIQNIIDDKSNTEDGFLYSIGHNIEDHIHEILNAFSEIIKIPS